MLTQSEKTSTDLFNYFSQDGTANKKIYSSSNGLSSKRANAFIYRIIDNTIRSPPKKSLKRGAILKGSSKY